MRRGSVTSRAGCAFAGSLRGADAEAEASRPGAALAEPARRFRASAISNGQVAREQAGIAEPVADDVAGQAVQVDPEAGRVERPETLGEQRSDRPGQDVACATAGQGRVLERRPAPPAIRRGDDGPGPLQDDDLAPARCRIPGGGRPRGIVVGQIAVGVGRDPAGRAEPGELAGVRGQDAGPSDAAPTTRRGGERAECLGVERPPVAGPPSPSTASRAPIRSAVARPGRNPGPTTSASCSWSMIRARASSGSTSSTSSSGQGHRRRLDDLRREQRLERLGDGQGDQTGAGPSGRPADEQCGARVVERAGDHEELAERALVAAGRALRHQRGDGLVVEHLERGR